MEAFKYAVDFVLHLNDHLGELVQNYGPWVYLILFLIVFCETGLVVTPFLPGDSLLFAVGALCGTGALDLTTCIVLLLIAAILGDTVNYWIGHWVGPKVFHYQKSRWLNPKHLERTHAFMEKYGGKAIIFARFAPILRTFAPFVAGIGRMTYARFMMYNVVGGIAWVLGFLLVGYFFGGLEVVKRNFTLIILAIIVISFIPPFLEFYRHWKESRRAAAQKSRSDQG
jgi:membrane-associated protein